MCIFPTLRAQNWTFLYITTCKVIAKLYTKFCGAIIKEWNRPCNKTNRGRDIERC